MSGDGTGAPGAPPGRGDADGDRGEAGALFARFAAPTAPTPTRIGLVADPHLAPDHSGTWKVLHRSEERLRTAVKRLNRRDVDATCVLGDLTRDGTAAEFDRAEAVLDDLDAPWYAVPGNHDVPKAWDDHDTAPVEAFAERFAPGLPFRRRVGEVDLVGLDSASGERLRGGIEGRVSADDLAWLDGALAGGGASVVALHHNLTSAARHTGPFPDADEYHLLNDDALADVLARHDDALVCSGHIHWPAVGYRGRTRELVAPAACSFPQAVLVAAVGPAGTEVRFLPLSGARGRAEAHAYAAAGNAHGRAVAAYADAGLALPLADESVAGAPPGEGSGDRAADRPPE